MISGAGAGIVKRPKPGGGMPQTNADAEIQAIQSVIKALEPLDDAARNRVLDYTLKRLGMHELSTLSSLSGHASEASRQTELEAHKPAQVMDIRSLRETKQPSSAMDMAAVVAYYLAEAAPVEERKESITTADL
jgi:hypothetical protein